MQEHYGAALKGRQIWILFLWWRSRTLMCISTSQLVARNQSICRIWYYNKPAYAACLCGQFSNTECFSPGFARETEGMLERMTMNKVLANTVCGMAPELCPPGNVLCQIQQAYCTGMINSRGTPGLDYAF